MNLQELEKIREKTLKAMRERGIGAKCVVKVDMGSAGMAAGAMEVYQTLLTEIRKRNVRDIVVLQTGELGMDAFEPIVSVNVKGKSEIYYGKVTPEIAVRIITDHIINGKILDEYVISIKEENREEKENV